MSVRTLWVAVAMACSFSTQAAVIDGITLRDDLQFAKEHESTPKDPGSYRSARISGYFIGVFDALEGLGLFCPPPTESISAIRNAALSYTETNSDRLDRPANVVIVEALKRAYPCPGKPG